MDNKAIRRANMLMLVDQLGSIKKLADATSTPPNYISQIKNQPERGMGDDVARRFEEKLRKPRGWMDTLQAPPPGRPADRPMLVQDAANLYAPKPEVMDVPVFDVRASMGLGAPMPEQDTVIDHLRLAGTWVRRHLPGVSSTLNLACISAYGNSMQPTFNDGDILLVDRGVSRLDVDTVYVLAFNEELYIKRIQRLPDKSVKIISDNKTYDPIVVPAGERESIRVLGKVVWAWNGKTP